LTHFYPFYLIYTDDLTAFTFYHIIVVYRIVIRDTLLPAMQDPSFTDLKIPEQFALAFGTFDR
jgi:hypothetical protein